MGFVVEVDKCEGSGEDERRYGERVAFLSDMVREGGCTRIEGSVASCTLLSAR